LSKIEEKKKPFVLGQIIDTFVITKID